MQSQTIQKQIEKIKCDLQKIGPMRPGSLNQRLTICGKSGCHCIDPINPVRHGPYYQLSYVHRGKSTTRFIRSQFVHEIKMELANYKKFRKLTELWVNLSLKSSSIRLDSLRKFKP